LWDVVWVNVLYVFDEVKQTWNNIHRSIQLLNSQEEEKKKQKWLL
jgi:hypothetical protein